MSAGPRSASLASRLVLLFILGSGVIMAGVGYALYHALRMQLETANLSEIRGKTDGVRHVLRDITSEETLAANLDRLRNVSVGHPHLSIGVLARERWIVEPRDRALSDIGNQARTAIGLPYVEIRREGRKWWVHALEHGWSGARAGSIVVVLAIETTESGKLLDEHAAVAALVVVVGILASALLAWLVTRRGLAPLSQVAARAEQVTAQQLGARLDVKDAPREIHGLADSINRMLERLEQSFRDLEQFSADIAHELRTPINNLLLQTQVTLSRSRESAEYQEALHSNLTELERIQRMVSEMLFLARADRRMLEIAAEEIDIPREIASVVDYFEAAMADKGQTLALAGGGSLRADRSMFRRAITNLLSNAVRYSPPGASLRIEIDPGDKETIIAVSNPGADIPAPELKRLFSRFARRDESRARDVEGTGLGLAIVDSIMSLQGGYVEAHCEKGLITFVLHFPSPTEPLAGRARSRPPRQDF